MFSNKYFDFKMQIFTRTAGVLISSRQQQNVRIKSTSKYIKININTHTYTHTKYHILYTNNNIDFLYFSGIFLPPTCNTHSFGTTRQHPATPGNSGMTWLCGYLLVVLLLYTWTTLPVLSSYYGLTSVLAVADVGLRLAPRRRLTPANGVYIRIYVKTIWE